MVKHVLDRSTKNLGSWEKNYPELYFLLRTAGKTKFMLAMSKKLQVLGMEKLYLQDSKKFWYFFMLFLLRDTILYIIIPIVVVYFIDL